MEKLVSERDHQELQPQIDVFEDCLCKLLRMASMKPPSPSREYYHKRLKTPAVHAWFQTAEAMVMLLTNSTIQVNFKSSHEKLIICRTTGNETITFIKPKRYQDTEFMSMNVSSFAIAPFSIETFEQIKFFVSAMDYLIEKLIIDINSF